MITVLAIDPSSTNTGWCFFGGAKSLCWSTQYKQALHAEKFGQAFLDVQAAIVRYDPSVVAMELPSSFKSHAATKVCFGLAGAIHAAAHVSGKAALEIHNETIKAHAGIKKAFNTRKMTAVEKAAARKQRLAELLAVARMLGFTVANDDEAVAALMADHVARTAVFGETLANACRPKRGRAA